MLPLINFYLNKFNKKYSREQKLSKQVIDILYKYQWEGNIRELENLIERLVITTDGTTITIDDLPNDFPIEYSQPIFSNKIESQSLPAYLNEVEKSIIIETYNETKSTWKTAEKLGVSQSYIVRRFKKYHLRISDKKIIED
ncbi:AAA-type ATPase lid domain-containing protein [Pallidibacillus thermolactis]